MSPKVTVININVHWGGLDQQLRYLAEQTYPISEFICVDGYYYERCLLLRELAEQLKLNFIHLPEPVLKYKTKINRCTNINKAIAHAKNELVVFVDAWHAIPKNFIEKHVEMYNMGYAGIIRWLHAPLVDLEDYETTKAKIEAANKYNDEELLRRLTTQEHIQPNEKMMDVIRNDYIEDNRVIHLRTEKNIEPCAGGIISDVYNDWWWPNSSSAPLEYVLAVGGFDETFNGGTGGEDVDIGKRMSRIGLKYAMNANITAYHIDTTDIRMRTLPYFNCTTHNRAVFTCNEYCQGDPNLVENEELLTWKEDGIKFFSCKRCGCIGPIDSGEILKERETRKSVRAPLFSIGIERTNITKLRKELGLPLFGPRK